MLKYNNQNKILNTLSKTLPDDRPITALQIVESIEKCPWGFFPISRTHDQDQDADLWREGSFLKRKSGRYLCLSKTEGLPDFVVQEILVLNEKSLPPEGYSLLHRTADSEQKAWRKKQLCYRLAHRNKIIEAVTDIIVCSRLKRAPEGFSLAGEINGVTVCFKMGNVQDSGETPNTPNHQPTSRGAYPKLNDNSSADGGDHDYEVLLPGYVPSRPAPPRPPAPAPPPAHQPNIAATLGPHGALDGVPFVLNPKVFCSNGAPSGGNRLGTGIPMIKARTASQLKQDYNYSFILERQSNA